MNHQTRRLSPHKLLLSKWTAVAPRDREKHFIVIKIVEPEPPTAQIEFVELEAVHSHRSFIIPWRGLTDCARWLQGWH